jgi:hypothetical protein
MAWHKYVSVEIAAECGWSAGKHETPEGYDLLAVPPDAWLNALIYLPKWLSDGKEYGPSISQFRSLWNAWIAGGRRPPKD